MLRKVWHESPDQRFGQLISNISDRKAETSLWRIEDYEWEKMFRDAAGLSFTDEEYKELVSKNTEEAEKSWKEFNEIVMPKILQKMAEKYDK